MFQACEVYHADRLQNPFYAKDSIINLRCASVLDKDKLINALKSSFVFCKSYSSELVAKKYPRIIQWHHNLCQNLKKSSEDNNKGTRLLLLQTSFQKQVSCVMRLKYLQKFAKVLVILQPSSAGSKRVFSLLINFQGSAQHKILHDIIFLSLCINYMNCDYSQFKFTLADHHDDN